MGTRKPPITPAQLTMLQSLWSRLFRESDPRACCCPGGLRMAGDEREVRLAWAEAHLGKKVDSFSDLSPSAAGYLLDVLQGKRTKIDLQLDRAFAAAGVRDPDAWLDVYLRILNVMDALNAREKWILCQVLASRASK